jgi:thymidylate synthase
MNNLDKQYLDLVNDIMINGVERKDRTGVGRKSVFTKVIRHDFKDGFPLLTSKKVMFKSLAYELLWFMGNHMKHPHYKHLPITNISFLRDHGVNIWNDWADADGNLGPIYGHQWINWGGAVNEYVRVTDKVIPNKEYDKIDFSKIKMRDAYNHPIGKNQLFEVFNNIKDNPLSTRHIVNAWNVNDLSKMALPPCHYSFQFVCTPVTDQKQAAYKYLQRIKHDFSSNKKHYYDVIYNNVKWKEYMNHEGYIEQEYTISLQFNMRSSDVFLGLPFNIASYGLLLEMFAWVLNMEPKELTYVGTDVHLYQNHYKQVEELNDIVNDKGVYDLPHLTFKNKKDSIFDFKYSDFKVKGYKSNKWIKAPIAV